LSGSHVSEYAQILPGSERCFGDDSPLAENRKSANANSIGNNARQFASETVLMSAPHKPRLINPEISKKAWKVSLLLNRKTCVPVPDTIKTTPGYEVLVPRAGIEPAAFPLGGGRSIHWATGAVPGAVSL
jgi:hypothetical protein